MTDTNDARFEAIQKTVDSLIAKNEQMATSITEITEKNSELTDAVSRMQKENAALKTQLGKSTAPEKKEEPAKIPDQAFSIGGKSYVFKFAKFRWKGETMTAMDAMTDKAILGELVKMGSGVIAEQA